MSESITIKADIMWAQLEQVNKKSKKYQVDLCNLSDRAVSALESLGINVRNEAKHADKGNFITCKSKHPIYAKGADGEDLRGILIGNGSEGVAKVKAYRWRFDGETGISPSLERLVITKLEVYEDEEEAPDLDEAL